MKKIVLLFLAAGLYSCCAISQIPPQYIFADGNCSGVLPDYRGNVVATDNCGIKGLMQTPEAGYVLDATNQSVYVRIVATDVFNNTSEVSFNVTLIDTVPPVIVADTSLFADNWSKIHDVYNIADKLVAEQEAYFDNYFDWDHVQINDSTYVEVPLELRPTAQYNQKIMVTRTSPRHAITGFGSRVITFENEP